MKDKIVLFITTATSGTKDDSDILEISWWVGKVDAFNESDIKTMLITNPRLVDYVLSDDPLAMNYWSNMGDYVFKLHRESGLVDDMESYIRSGEHRNTYTEVVDSLIADILKAKGYTEGVNARDLPDVYLTGNNIPFLLSNLSTINPEGNLRRLLSYQTIDVTSLILFMGKEAVNEVPPSKSRRTLDTLIQRVSLLKSLIKYKG